MKRFLIIIALSCAAFGQTAVMGSFTVATLPAAANSGRLAFITDGSSAVTCSSGSGSTVVLCKDTGAAWSPVATPACVTCVTSAASLTSNAVVIGGGSQASATISADTTTTHALFATAGAPAFRAIAASDLPSSKRSCEIAVSGSGTAFALTAGDDVAVNNSCFNKEGVTHTITAVYCKGDPSSNTTTVNPTFGAAGTGTTILSGALTCGSSDAYSSTGTVSNGALADGNGINVVMGGTLKGTNIHVLVVYTVPAS